MKERYAQTNMMKLVNRMQFGVPEESSLGYGLGKGYGLLGQAGSGRLRVSTVESKPISKISKRLKEKNCGSGRSIAGLTSSLAFTPVQGMELSSPFTNGNIPGRGTGSTYFSDTGTFAKISKI